MLSEKADLKPIFTPIIYPLRCLHAIPSFPSPRAGGIQVKDALQEPTQLLEVIKATHFRNK